MATYLALGLRVEPVTPRFLRRESAPDAIHWRLDVRVQPYRKLPDHEAPPRRSELRNRKVTYSPRAWQAATATARA